MLKPKLLFLVTEDWYFVSHRLDLARLARDAGCQVVVAARFQVHRGQIEGEGFRTVPIRLRRSGRAPLGELLTIADLVRIYRRERPDIVHHVAMKPVLYGSWAARLAGVPAVVNAFGGLGYLFIARGWSARVLRSVASRALRAALDLPNARIIMQNEEDVESCVRAGILSREQVTIVRGSGVDVGLFHPTPLRDEARPTVALPARMLWDKGVGEFVEAARLLRLWGVNGRFLLVGRLDPDNPTGIREPQLRRWIEEGVVEWSGHRNDMESVLSEARIVVLPSYREGLPKVLLEAAAAGRAVVATDVPGCREIVRDGRNGLLVPARDAEALARAIATLLGDRRLCEQMGIEGRRIAVEEFSVERIAREQVAVYRALLERAAPRERRLPIDVPGS